MSPLGNRAIGYETGFSRWIQRTLLRRVDLVIAVSSMTKTQLLQLEPSLTGRVEVAHTGVPSALFQLARLPREEALRVVVIGALSAEKNPVAAVNAIVGLGDAKLRIVGSGPLEQEVLEAAQPLAAVGGSNWSDRSTTYPRIWRGPTSCC